MPKRATSPSSSIALAPAPPSSAGWNTTARCRRNPAGGQMAAPRPAASRCARHGRRHASCRAFSRHRAGWSVRHWQGIHICPEPDDPATGIRAATDEPDNSGAPEPGHHLIAAEGAQLVCDNAGRALHIIEHFRVRMEILSPTGNLRAERVNLGINGRHGSSPGVCRSARRGPIAADQSGAVFPVSSPKVNHFPRNWMACRARATEAVTAAGRSGRRSVPVLPE
jgi:hypothetical protein